MDSKIPSFTLTGKVALITGAARGIGKACALALAGAGADIILGLHDKNSGGSVVREIKALGRDVVPVQMDISKISEIKSAINEGYQHFKRIDVLVNNAGIGAPAPAEEVNPDYS